MKRAPALVIPPCWRFSDEQIERYPPPYWNPPTEDCSMAENLKQDGKLVDGKLELYFADGSSFSHPVIAGRIVDPGTKAIDLSPTEYQRLNFGKLD